MRKIFSKFGIDQFEAPNLVQVQLDSYKWFLDIGLRELLKNIKIYESDSNRHAYPLPVDPRGRLKPSPRPTQIVQN